MREEDGTEGEYPAGATEGEKILWRRLWPTSPEEPREEIDDPANRGWYLDCIEAEREGRQERCKFRHRAIFSFPLRPLNIGLRGDLCGKTLAGKK